MYPDHMQSTGWAMMGISVLIVLTCAVVLVPWTRHDPVTAGRPAQAADDPLDDRAPSEIDVNEGRPSRGAIDPIRGVRS